MPIRSPRCTPAWTCARNSDRYWRVIRAGVFLLCLVPLARLLVLGFTHRLGANPVEFVTHSTGTWTLVFLCLTLTVTPLRRLSGWNGVQRYRRMLGLFSFFYAVLHLTTYVWFDQWFDVAEIAKDIVKRPFITVGFLAFVLMLPLALTSTHAAQRRLGRRWARLHRLVYVAAIAAMLHYWWDKGGKNDFQEPIIYGTIVLSLLAIRLWYALRRARVAPVGKSLGQGPG